jgi:hypothetical protein
MYRSATVIGVRAALASTFLALSVPVLAQTGLVAAYGVNEGGGASATDTSGNGHSGVITGSTWTAGKFGGALSFDGAADWVTINHTPLLALTSGMTLEAWVKASSVTNWRCVILKERSGGLSYGLYAGDTGGHPAAFIRSTGNSGDTDATGSAVLPLNTWVHVATTYDGATLRTYVGGQQVAATSTTGAIETSTEPLRIGGNSIWGEYFSGAIDEVRIYNRALTAAEIQTDMVTPVGVAAPTTFALSGTITPSAAGSGTTLSLSGSSTGTVTADANGNYSFSGLVNGTYAVTPSKPGFTFVPVSQSVAINEAAATGVNFTATSTTTGNTPDVVGQWGTGFDVGTVAVNMVMLRTGKVLMFSGSYAFSAAERVWDSATGTITLVPNPFYNLFCAGQAQLPDGRILVAGGHDPAGLGAANANIFDPISQAWSSLPNMSFRRWYPTVTALPDGRMLVTSGAQTCQTCFAEVPEVFDPVSKRFSQLTSARLGIDYYPFMFVLPDGRLLSAGSNEGAYETRTLNIATGAWSMVDPVIKDGHSAVMYRPGKVLKTGTAADSGTTGTAAATAYVIDMTQPSPAWRQVTSMKCPRAFQNMTLLPDGNVLVTGGGTVLDGYDVGKGVLTAELWSPATETFKTLSPASFARLYHSTALLLPDGRVLIAGSGNDGPAVNQTRAELYSPPYLFKGARPAITSAPDLVQYGSAFTVQTPNAASIASVALIRPGAVTHGFDQDQRFLNLSFTAGAGSLTIQAPANANLAPPGYYMLFLVNAAGVPSIASFVHFPTAVGDTTPPSPPANLVGVGDLGSASLTWSPATDDIGVSNYNVHRSTISGFTPSPANRIAQTAAPSFNSAGIPPGTYFYLVTAQDAAGNVSSASNEAVVVVLGDTTAPSVAIATPLDQSHVSGPVAVTANATDDVGVVGVQFQVDGASLGAEILAAPYALSWVSATSANGPHTLTAIARDAAGNRAQSAVSVFVSNATADTTQPAVTITSPANQATATGSVTISASSTDNVGVVGVQFQVDGTAIGNETATAPYSIVWNSASVSDGPHTITAIARDAAGNSSASSVTIAVLNVAPPPPPATGLVAAYNFDEGSGTRVTDASGSGNTGTVLRATWSTAGHSGSALSFGNNAWVTVADAASLDLKNGMTVEAWVHPTSNGGARVAIYKERNTAFAYGLWSSTSSSKPRAAVRTSVDYMANAPTSIPTNAWTHLAATYDGSRIRLFVNGVEADSVLAVSTITASSGALRIGGNSRTEYFKGLIDDVRIYNRALSAAEIQGDMSTAVK